MFTPAVNCTPAYVRPVEQVPHNNAPQERARFSISHEMRTILKRAVVTFDGGWAGNFTEKEDPGLYALEQLGWE